MTNEPEYYLFPVEVLKDFSARVFMHFGVAAADAAQAADVLARSDLSYQRGRSASNQRRTSAR